MENSLIIILILGFVFYVGIKGGERLLRQERDFIIKASKDEDKSKHSKSV